MYPDISKFQEDIRSIADAHGVSKRAFNLEKQEKISEIQSLVSKIDIKGFDRDELSDLLDDLNNSLYETSLDDSFDSNIYVYETSYGNLNISFEEWQSSHC